MCVTAAALGAPVAAVVQRCGTPQSVASDNTGNHVVFAVDGGTADALIGADTAVVQAIYAQGTVPAAALSAPYRVSDDDVMYTFGDTRVYRIGGNRALVFVRDGVIIGELGTLLRLRVIPGRINEPGFAAYAPPKLTRGHGNDGTGSRATVVRIDVDSDGIVRTVATIVPSADAPFDASLAARFGDDRYAPATFYGKPIGGSVFREIRH
jgi:hypothetical protein